MKKTRKWISLLCAMVMVFLLAVPAGAATIPTAESVINRTEIVLEEHEGYVLSLVGEDLENGGIRFSMVENGETISVSYLNNSEHKIICTRYESGEEIFREEENIHSDCAERFSAYAAAPYVSVGKVGYYHYVQGMIAQTNYIEWSCRQEPVSYTMVDVRGTYRDIANFAASVCGFLGLFSAAPALVIVNAILAVLGLTGTVGEIIVPVYKLDCAKYEVFWRANVGTIVAPIYQGARCEATHPDGHIQTVYDGDYYSPDAIALHNTTLALDPYQFFFPGSDNREIASWPL